MDTEATRLSEPKHSRSNSLQTWLFDLLLVLILIGGASLRIVGLNWDANLHAHPDERFLTMVESQLTPVKSLAEYFNTAQSGLNPANHGFHFFVYGTLPIFLVRYVGQWLNQTGYDQIFLVGRQLSGIFDLITVFFVFLIGSRLYNRRVGVLAALFSALAVLQIQLSHYFVVDTFATCFITAAVYVALHIMGRAAPFTIPAEPVGEEDPADRAPVHIAFPSLGLFVLFGAALGLAVASKVDAAVVAAVLPVAVIIHFSRLPREDWEGQIYTAVVYMAIATLTGLLIFRIIQPYAFSGPGFLGVSLNNEWVQSLKSLSQQSTGASDSPPELQWTNRPVWFGLYNLVAWGMGWPLGILAWIGFLWMGWRILHGEWREHGVIWLWTGLYFIWRSIAFTKTMRYDLAIYPTLEVMAAWTVIRLWDLGREWSLGRLRRGSMSGGWLRAAAAVIGVVAVVATGAWAFAFTRIYTRTNDWLAASQWIYQNVPGPLELPIQTASGSFNQQLPYRNSTTVTSGAPLTIAFRAEFSGLLVDVSLPHVLGLQLPQEGGALTLMVGPVGESADPRSVGSISGDFKAQDDLQGAPARVTLDRPLALQAGHEYSLQITASSGSTAVNLSGPATLTLQGVRGANGAQGVQYQPLPVFKTTISPDAAYSDSFVAQQSGSLAEVILPRALDISGAAGDKTLRLTITPMAGGGAGGTAGSISGSFAAGPANADRTGQAYRVKLEQPIQLVKGETYTYALSMVSGQGQVTLYGSATAIETDWDVPMPYNLDGYPVPWDKTSGIYQWDLNYQAYAPDDPKSYADPHANKLNQLLTILDQANYIFISSNRQWGATTRVPQRYPLTTAYYQDLIGCPDNQSILVCYSQAQPGSYQGKLGFELVATFQSNPNLGPLQINDQLAEEAFTVYDHPKVLIFKKTAAYSQQGVAAKLGAVDLTHIIDILPDGKVANPAGGDPASAPTQSLLLPADRLAADQAGGTWSALFNYDALVNRFPGIGMLVWYLAILLLGWFTYPIVRLALPGLSDRGYPMARMAGLLILSLIVWLAGSFKVPFTRETIAIAAGGLALTGVLLGAVQRKDLARAWRENKKYFVWIEIIALTFFAIDLLIRLGNPDLWHPAYGGEKPMDFSFFNAVIKSTSFPPFDPWFAGGYINYYYYGMVIFGVPVKALGIVPSIAYNLILPTIFSLLALGAFSLGWNLTNGLRPHAAHGEEDILRAGSRLGRWLDRAAEPFYERPFLVGLASAIGLLVLGNLGTVRMVWYGIQKLVAPDGNVEGASILQHWAWTLQGLPQWLSGARLPYSLGDWYWIPSRVVIPSHGNEITEFPMFTMLYADPHAHLFALPVTLLVIAWGLSVVLGCARWGEADGRHRWLSFAASFFLGAAAVGALRPTNTWDYYTYIVFSCAALLYAIFRYYQPAPNPNRWLPEWSIKLGFAVDTVILLVGLSILLYQPFNTWFAQGYTSIIPWNDGTTPFWSYITHWGLFLFAIVSWMAWETWDWMATTPISALARLKPYLAFIEGFAILVIGAVVVLLFKGIQIAWLVIPLAVWAAVLMLRPGFTDTKRFVLFMTGTGLILTLVVELFVVKGDIGRQNTIFKFYMQAWTLMSISAAAGLGWLFQGLPVWRPNLRIGWTVGLAVLVFGAALFPITAARAKILDRMTPSAPHTLDGMTFLQSSFYDYGPDNQPSKNMDLNQDYQAIRWLQDNVQGSPVIVEAHTSEYRWENRITMFTGLPGVVGYQWHEQQQRSMFGNDPVVPRVNAVDQFYNTSDPQIAAEFLNTYNVKYIIVGQLEEVFYPEGLAKFQQLSGILWKQVYHQADTSIYAVLPNVQASRSK
jgi:YYY domain-containing protein